MQPDRKVQVPNFCRQLLAQVLPELQRGHEPSGIYTSACDLAQKAQKFMLPLTGRLLDDKQFRALDETQPLRLPFSVIALEFFADVKSTLESGTSSKRIVIAQEEADRIWVHPVWWNDERKKWICFHPFSIPSIGYLDRSIVAPDGQVTMNIRAAVDSNPADMTDDLGCILGFLNALQCSNVRTDTIQPRKAGKTVKAALTFDEYHILTIETASSSDAQNAGGSHRSPREHLRRGHIRRLESGRKIWINAAIIGAGKGAGKISKDYQVTT